MNCVLRNLSFVAMLGLIGCSFVAHSKEDKSTNRQPSSIVFEVWIKETLLQALPMDKVRYSVGSADLNDNKKNEHFILIQDQYFCGSGGCTAEIFDNKGNIIKKMTVTSAPVLLTKNKTHGWRDFIVWSNGQYRLMQHDGKAYPTNPSVQPIVNRDKEMQQAMSMVKKQSFTSKTATI